MVEIILGSIILILVADRIFTQRHYNVLIDRMTDKILSRDYSDYQTGQAIKKEEANEEVILPHTDEAEAVIEENRNQGLLKHIKEIDKEFEGTMLQ
jgi:uncharacterized UBP type Zn finger protein